METFKINYLIAASAHRGKEASGCVSPGEILRYHLQKLLETDLSNLEQVTVVRSLPLSRHGKYSERYWDIEEFIEKIPCKVELLKYGGGAFSYGLWSQACKKYKDKFDYYILVEDDYYPEHKDFVKILVNEHKKRLPEGGYLAAFITNHAAVSNGIVDSKSFLEAISEIEKKENLLVYLNRAAQVNFSLMFGDRINDYSSNYRVLFNIDLIECSHDYILGKKDIFNPVQYIVNPNPKLPFQKIPKSKWFGRSKTVVTDKELIKGLTKLGMQKNDNIIVHSSLSSFGFLKGGVGAFIDSLGSIISDGGIIMMPTFTYGTTVFDKYNTPSETGYVSEVFRNKAGVVRSEHPSHSVCACGATVGKFIYGHGTESAFGVDSPMHRMVGDGYVLLVGVDYTACSLIHVAQELAAVDYIDRTKNVSVVGCCGSTRNTVVRRAGCSRGFNKIEKYLHKDYVSETTIGESIIKLIPAKILVETAVSMLKKDQESLLCDNEDCFSCDEARKMIGGKNDNNN